jgi:hypothetical protein
MEGSTGVNAATRTEAALAELIFRDVAGSFEGAMS